MKSTGKVLQTHADHKKQKLNFLLGYSCLFIIAAFLIYGYFLLRNKSLIVGGDGWKQHFMAFVYFGQYGRQVLRTLLTEHTLVLPEWNFSIGYGGDVLTTLHYYVIGDPLDLLSVLVPTKYAAYLYSFLSLFRLYLAGLSFSAFCFYKKKTETPAVAAGALIYIFFTYTFFLTARHPFFVNPMIYLPLLFIGVEKIIAKERPYLFILTVCLMACSNFYFFYMLVLLTVLYVFYRLFFIYKKTEIKQAVLAVLRIGGYAVVGVMMSAVILLPVITAFFGDERNSGEYIVKLFYDADFYKNFLSAYITSSRKVGNQTYLGFSAAALPAIFLLFIRKGKNKELKIAFILSTLCLCIPAFGWIMNGLSYVTNRWIWAYALLIAYIFTTMWNEWRSISKKEFFILLALLAVYTAVCLPLSDGKTENTLLSLCIALLTIAVFAAKPKIKKAWVTQILAFVLILGSFAGNAYFLYDQNQYDFVNSFVSYESAQNKLKSTTGKKVKKAAKNDTDFYRYSGSNLVYNSDLVDKTYSTSFYWSIQNPVIAQFMDEMKMPIPFLYSYKNLNNSASLNALASVKYYIPKKNKDTYVPYGFTKMEEGVYQSKHAMPLGYTYSGYITRAQYDALSPVQKQSALLQGILLEQEVPGYAQAQPVFTDVTPDYHITTDANVAQKGNTFYVYEKNAQITFNFNGLENSETYLLFNLTDYTNHSAYDSYQTHADDPLNRYSEAVWKQKSEAEKKEIKKAGQGFRPISQLNFKIKGENDSKKYPTYKMKCNSKYDLRYDGRTAFLLSAGYSEMAKTKLTFTFEHPGIYTFSDLTVIEQPMDDFGAQTDVLKTDVLKNVQINTDEITGEIELENQKILYLSVPYSKGWTAFVDGKETELLQANTMYMALPLEAGKHTIRLVYHTPYLKAGACLSATGCITFAGILLITEKKRRKLKTDIQ